MKEKSSLHPAAQLAILVAGVVVLGAGLVWFAGRSPAVPTPNTNVSATGGGETDGLTVRMETFSEKTPIIEINVRYPQVDGISNIEQAEQLNGEMKQTAIAWMDQYKREVTDTGAPDPLGSKSTIDMEATMAFLAPEMISVRYEVSVYSAGAAHPNMFYKTLNWDIVRAANIQPNNLFKTDADWVSRFSTLAIADLERQLSSAGDDFEAMSTDIRQGAGPKAENFSSWTMNRDGITLHFEPYKVAAYAAGPQHVVIPWNQLSEILDSSGPAASLYK